MPDYQLYFGKDGDTLVILWEGEEAREGRSTRLESNGPTIGVGSSGGTVREGDSFAVLVERLPESCLHFLESSPTSHSDG